MQWHKYDVENFPNGEPAEYHESDGYLFIVDNAGLHLHLNLFNIRCSLHHRFDNLDWKALPLAKHICLLYSRILNTYLSELESIPHAIRHKLASKTIEEIAEELTLTGWLITSISTTKRLPVNQHCSTATIS